MVWQAPGEIELLEVPDARIEQPGDAVVRLTMSAICGTDLHMVRGTMPDMVLGHEGVGVVEAVGGDVRGDHRPEPEEVAELFKQLQHVAAKRRTDRRRRGLSRPQMPSSIGRKALPAPRRQHRC